MKICKDCNQEKNLSDFYKAKTSRDGHQSHCKECHNTRSKNNYYEKHVENRARLSKYYEDNHEKEKAARREHYKKNKSAYLFNFYKREERLREATPSWLTDLMISEIKQIYAHRQKLSESTGVEYHVDHVVPIQGDNVCGLHVPWNLQIITAEENLKKSNKYE
jgi:hypothetical protein